MISTSPMNRTTVGDLVASNPALSRVFERLGIDYCCGGKVALAEACERKGLDFATVRAMVEAMAAAPASTGPSASEMSLTALCGHIVQTHHQYLRNELPRLGMMAAKVADAHGDHHAWTHDLATVLSGLSEELMSHMMKEERVLFPAIRAMEAGQPMPMGLMGPISVMEQEHDSAGVALEQMRSLSGGYTPPEDACNTFRALLSGLSELESDLHEHIHKENNILFPRSLDFALQG